METGRDKEEGVSEGGKKKPSWKTSWAWRLITEAPVVSLSLAGVIFFLGMAGGWSAVGKSIGLVLSVICLYFVWDFFISALRKREALYNWAIIISAAIGAIIIALALINSVTSGGSSCNRFDDSGC